MKAITKFPFHPFLFAIFPILSLMSHNLGQISLVYIIRPLIVFGLLSILILFVINAIIRNWAKSGIITTGIIVYLTSYGMIFDSLKPITILGISLNHRFVLALFYMLIIGGITIYLTWGKRDQKITNQFLIIVSLAALLIPSFQIVSYNLTSNRVQNEVSSETAQVATNFSGNKPDIYYFILDDYSRSDRLQKAFHIDNTSFLTHLKNMGFYVADCSQSNYGYTRLSLASSLNMDYLNVIAPKATPDIHNSGILDEQILHSKVRTDLEALGYKTVSFQTGYLFTEFQDSAYYYPTSAISMTHPYLYPFESLLLEETAFRLLEIVPAIDLWAAKGPSYDKYLIEHNKMELVKNLNLPSPKFVFVHLLAAHHPFVFSENGGFQPYSRSLQSSSAPTDTYLNRSGYSAGIAYLDSALIPILQQLVSQKNPPIIIIQGDHGNLVLKEEEILNAYYFPDSNYKSLYSTITPVNSFRVVFNHFFGSSMPMLPDHSYASKDPADPFVFTDYISKSSNCSPDQ